MRIKKQLVIFLSGLLVFASFPLAALADKDANSTSSSGTYSEKDEVVYGKLDVNGNTKDLYVVNSFHVTEAGEITDYGNYTSVRNLTDLSDIEQKGANRTQFQAEDGEFYYQGELRNIPLPWDISIIYFLDGEEMNPEELAGKSGQLKIQLTTSANEAVDPMFFEYYLLQISLTFDPLTFNDIQAPKGTEANEGKNKQMTFTVLPEQDETFIVSANVTDLEMDPMEIAATPANIGIDSPNVDSMKDDMKTLSDAISDIHSGVGDFKNGVIDFSDGANELNKGSSEYRNGITELDQSSGELVEGSEQIHEGLQEISAALQESPDMPDLGELESLPEGFREMAGQLREFITVLDELDEAIKNIEEIDGEKIEQIYEALENNDVDEDDDVVNTVNQLEQTYNIALTIKELNEEILSGLVDFLNDKPKQLDDLADELDEAMGSLDLLDDLVELQEGLSALSVEYDSFHNGLVTYTDGVHELAINYEEIDEGTEEVSDGAATLYDGINELHDGTQELHDETSDLPGQMQSEIDEFMEDFDYTDFEPTSFVSDENENVGVVQFVLQTEEIEIEEEGDEAEEVEEEKNLWDRFLDLFR